MVNNWLITGGCGFIGTATIKEVLRNNPKTRICVLDNLSVGDRKDLATVTEFSECAPAEAVDTPGVSLVVADIRDAEAAELCARRVDVILHLAANTGVGPSVEDPRLDMESNVIGTFNMLEAARKQAVHRFIFASSGASVGEVEPPIHEELTPHPVSPYGASKLAGEGYCSAYAKTFGLGTVCLRFGNVFGPGSSKKYSVVAKFIRQALNGETCEIYGDGSQTRDFIFIDDLIDAIIRSAEADCKGEVFQIASSKERTVIEMATIISTMLKNAAGLDMRIEHGEKRLGDVMRNFSDTTKAREQLGWESRMDIEQGVRNTVDFFLQNENR